MKCTTQIPLDQLLIDINPKSGKVLPWNKKKKQTDLMADAHIRIHETDPDFTNRASKLYNCGEWLEFYRNKKSNEKVLSRANFCKYRLCPMCNWRRSLKMYGQAHQIIEAARQRKYDILFVTLTVKNCYKSQIRRTLDNLYKSLVRLNRRKDITKVVKGWMRSIEITHNIDSKSKNYDTLHPHIHMLWAVDPHYFTSRYYISQAKLTDIWRKSGKLDYKPIVDIRRAKTKNNGDIREISKYATKPNEILLEDPDLTDSVIWSLDQALENRRLIAFGGILKKIKKDLNFDDIESGDLVRTDGLIDPEKNPGWIKELFTWKIGYNTYIKK